MKLQEDLFVDRLRQVIDRLGTRREAADIGGVSVDAIIRYLRGENHPGFAIVARLCAAAGFSVDWLATGSGTMEARQGDQVTSRGVPVMGFAETKEAGWYNTQQSTVQTTLDLNDPQAFATMVHGQGLIPEGIQPGFMCVCSPMLRPVAGDVVHLRRLDGLCTLRLFQGEEGEWLVLKSYTDKDAKGTQRAFEDRVKRNVIAAMAPVVFIKRKL